MGLAAVGTSVRSPPAAPAKKTATKSPKPAVTPARPARATRTAKGVH